MRCVLETLTNFLGILILALAVLAAWGDWADANCDHNTCNAPGEPNCVVDMRGRCPEDHETVCQTALYGCSTCVCEHAFNDTTCACQASNDGW